QKLVTVLPDSADDRLLLARCFMAAGNKSWADRTLWAAFQDIQADDKIYAALLNTRNGNADATVELTEEFQRQRDNKLSRGLLECEWTTTAVSLRLATRLRKGPRRARARM